MDVDSQVSFDDKPLLSVKDLRVSFQTKDGWKEVVKGLSFDLFAGETLAIVGESGSGKSVTALAIMRLLSKEMASVEGSINFAGEELLSASDRVMRDVRGNKISMIFQEAMTSLNPVLSIGSQIAEIILLHKKISRRQAQQEALRLMERVRIPSAKTRYNQFPHNFSGGMRQRAMIAMALACGPRILIADEPTTALDVTIQAQIIELIKQLQDEDGMAVVFITHDMGVVAETADRTLVMYGGEQVEAGTTAKIFEAGEHPYTRVLLDAVPRMGLSDGQSATETNRRSSADIMVDYSSSPALKVTDLVTRFDMRTGILGRVSARVHAVENVSFDLYPGETLAIVGESGCGKSTLGRSLLQLVTPRSGEIEVEGEKITGSSGSALRQARQKIQMIFQDPFASLDPRQNVGSAIAEPFLTHGLGNVAEAEARVTELLAQVGLTPDMAQRQPHQFSGGQRQRICIARALALSPKIIVADEAVAALDVALKAQVIDLMLDLQQRYQLSYLFISHDMAAVERISHRVAVMQLGRIVEVGPSHKVFADPQHPYTKRLLDAVPVPDPARRCMRRKVDDSELGSPVRAVDYQPPASNLKEVSPSHFVQQD